MNSLKGLGHQNIGAPLEEMSLQAYLDLCKENPLTYATAAERLLAAVGKPEVLDTSTDPRLLRIFHNRVIERYAPFADFHGMEEAVMQIVAFFRHAAQGWEERKQVLYLLGPVGGGKSSIAEKLKSLMEKYPIYVAAVRRNNKLEISPVFESPLSLFEAGKDADILSEEYGISSQYLGGVMSPWMVKRLCEFKGDISQFLVVRMLPNQLLQVGVSKTEPGDENNQDISALVGKVDLRMLDEFEQNDTDAYSYSGTLCRANQGLMEFVEMFKAPIKVLHPLITATQEGNYKGTEGLGAIPFNGQVVAHSNEAEWEKFKSNKDNEAFIDRILVVKIPYCLRVSDEVAIYKKLIRGTKYRNAPCAPKTLEILAQLAVLSRLRDPENSSVYSKMRTYDGESLKDVDPKAKSHQEYIDMAGIDEGMSGLSTRAAYKLISKLFNFDRNEAAANPVHLFLLIQQYIVSEYGKSKEEGLEERGMVLLDHLESYLIPQYIESIGKDIQAAYLASYSEYGQNQFDRYIMYADFWVQDQEYRDPESGQIFDRAALDEELSKVEKPAGISNPKDFRNEVVNFVLRARAKNDGKNPLWTSYEKMRQVIEHKMFSAIDELLPIISYNAKASKEDQKKHADYVTRMVEQGYTEKQVRLISEWYLKSRKSH